MLKLKKISSNSKCLLSPILGLVLTLSLILAFTGCASHIGKGHYDSLSAKNNHSSKLDSDIPVRDFSIPIAMNEHIQKWIDYFTQRDPERFQRFLDRGNAFKDVVQTILRENELPVELYYLALIESGYSTHAKSRAKAVGTWQFIKETAKRYDLLIDPFVDERRDPIRATEAAARYLDNLYTRFGTWELAMAAYNCGENRVSRAIKQGGTNDYWELVDRHLLPKETMNYVPKFMAAILIGENPEYYGFHPPSEDNIYPSIQTVEVPSPVKLAVLAETTSISVDELKNVNPHLIHEMTPPAVKSYEVWIPEDKIEMVKQKVPMLAELTMKPDEYKGFSSKYGSNGAKDAEAHYRYRSYIVRKGDSLQKIAKRFRVSVPYLRNLNDLEGASGAKLALGQRILVSSKAYNRADVGEGTFHLLRKGDTLSDVAKQYNISVQMIKDLNHLTSHKVYPGQKLRVKPFKNAKETVFHIVQKGDTVSSICKQYKIKAKKLRNMNDLSKKESLQVGQKLRVQ